MHFWFSKMLWNTKVEINWNIKESIQEMITREHIQCLVSTRPFSQKNKQKLQYTQASWNIQIKIYKCDPHKSSIYVRKVTVKRNKRIRNEPEGRRAPEFGCTILHASHCFLRLFKRKLKEFSSCFKPKGRERIWSVWIRPDIKCISR